MESLYSTPGSELERFAGEFPGRAVGRDHGMSNSPNLPNLPKVGAEILWSRKPPHVAVGVFAHFNLIQPQPGRREATAHSNLRRLTPCPVIPDIPLIVNFPALQEYKWSMSIEPCPSPSPGC